MASEGAFDDRRYSGRDVADVEHDDGQAGEEVEHSHERHDGGSCAGDALETAECDGSDEHGEHDVSHVGRHAERDVYALYDGVYLSECTDAEEGNEHAEYGEDDGQRTVFFAEAELDVVHRAAGYLAELVFGAVLDSEQAFRILGGHAEECGYPHPEDSAGAAGSYSRSDADDVAGADRGGHSDAQCFKAADIAGALVLGRRDELHGQRQLCHLQEL